MTNAVTHSLVEAICDAWHRNNAVLVNLVQALPMNGLEARATPTSPRVSEMLMHMHHERIVSVSEEVPELHPEVPGAEWLFEPNADRIVSLLKDSAQLIEQAVKMRIEAGRAMSLNYAHPAHLIQFLIFHEGYHHGQIKLALKIGGCPIDDSVAGPLTWDVWRSKSYQSGSK